MTHSIATAIGAAILAVLTAAALTLRTGDPVPMPRPKPEFPLTVEVSPNETVLTGAALSAPLPVGPTPTDFQEIRLKQIEMQLKRQRVQARRINEKLDAYLRAEQAKDGNPTGPTP